MDSYPVVRCVPGPAGLRSRADRAMLVPVARVVILVIPLAVVVSRPGAGSGRRGRRRPATPGSGQRDAAHQQDGEHRDAGPQPSLPRELWPMHTHAELHPAMDVHGDKVNPKGCRAPETRLNESLSEPKLVVKVVAPPVASEPQHLPT